MRPALARFLICLGRFIQSLAIMVMRPKDLVEFSRLTYARPRNIEIWSNDKTIDAGLSIEETALFERITFKKGRALILCAGGGREALYLAGRGFEVTAMDYLAQMIEQAKANALKKGLKINGFVGEISDLKLATNSYEIIWLSVAMYSCVPIRKRRIKMLSGLKSALRPGGYLACQFYYDPKANLPLRANFARRLFAVLTFGNLWYEPGDTLLGNIEFIHAFSCRDEIMSEFKEAGFSIDYVNIKNGPSRGEILALKN